MMIVKRFVFNVIQIYLCTNVIFQFLLVYLKLLNS